MKRREFLQTVAASTALASLPVSAQPKKRPNIVFAFGDQWRAQATGYAGDPNVRTPHIDQLAADSVNLTNAIAQSPVCCPYRGTLMTGQYPDHHGVFLNDVHLPDNKDCIAEVLNRNGYNTGYIGKWHLNGLGRSSFIKEEHRQGWEYWKVLECTHNYNQSYYYGDSPEKKMWDGYDVFAQTEDAAGYIREHADDDKPFALFLSWGPPHNPYQTAPEKYNDMYDPAALELRGNVPADAEEWARRDLAGYYAHCTAMDDAVKTLRDTLRETGIEDDTIFVFTSDHGDMLGSQGEMRKQRPWEESIHVPFLMRYPNGLGREGREFNEMFSSVDIMPTLLGLCGIDAPASVQGRDYTSVLKGNEAAPTDSVLIACYAPFGEWKRSNGGREFRGVRTKTYTYVRTLDGPWLLYDNVADPFQNNNLAGNPDHKALQSRLDDMLQAKLAEADDEFLHGDEYIARWGYEVDETGTVPIK